MRTPRTVALLAGIAALAGCNLAPAHVRPVGAVPATLPAVGPQPTAIDAADVSAIAWRDFFTDPRLRGAVALGLDNNRDLRIAAANVLRARAIYRIQRADRLPTVTVGTSASVGNSAGLGVPGAAGGTTELYAAEVGVSAFELDLFGRVRNLSRAALEEYFATEEAQRATRVSLIAEIASVWLQLAADQDQLQTARQTLASFGQSLELTRARFRIGVSSELEVRQAETLFEGARNDIAVLTTRIAQDRNALDSLVGAPVAPALLPAGLGAVDHTLPQLPAGLSSDVLLRRPDVLQAERLLLARNADIGAARAALFPSISLTAALGTVSTALSGLFGAGSDSWNLGASAGLPIFDAGRRRNNVRAAEADQQAAVAAYERTLQVAFREVADALALRGTIGEQLAAREARLRAAEVAARLSEARYRAGIDSFLTFLDAQRTAYAARQDLIATRLNRANNLVELYRSLGGGLS